MICETMRAYGSAARGPPRGRTAVPQCVGGGLPGLSPVSGGDRRGRRLCVGKGLPGAAACVVSGEGYREPSPWEDAGTGSPPSAARSPRRPARPPRLSSAPDATVSASAAAAMIAPIQLGEV